MSSKWLRNLVPTGRTNAYRVSEKAKAVMMKTKHTTVDMYRHGQAIRQSGPGPGVPGGNIKLNSGRGKGMKNQIS